MFSDITTAHRLVADRQTRYHHEAQQHRLARLTSLGRRARRTTAPTTAPVGGTGLGTVEPLPSRVAQDEHRPAA